MFDLMRLPFLVMVVAVFLVTTIASVTAVPQPEETEASYIVFDPIIVEVANY